MKFKVLQINSTCNWGSTGHIAEELGKHIIKNKWESYIAYGRKNAITCSTPIKIGSAIFSYIHVIFSRILGIHGLLSILPTLIFIKKIRKIQPNLIHLHNIHGYYLNYRLLFNFIKKSGIPIIWTLHDCWAYTGHCAYYSSFGCDRWKKGCYNCNLKYDYPKSFIDNSKFNYKLKKDSFTNIPLLRIVTVSDWLKKEVELSFLGKYKIRTIHNGIDINKFTPLPSIKEDICSKNKTLILGVANVWDKRKGLQDFIKLSSLLDEKYYILLIGLTSKQIAELPKNNIIHGIRRTNTTEELASYYSSADVYINMSVEETLGMTSIESMACGTPVIAFDNTGCSEVVKNNIGFLVQPHDLNAIADILQKYISGQNKLYSVECRNYVISNFSEDERYKDYISLYKEMLNLNN